VAKTASTYNQDIAMSNTKVLMPHFSFGMGKVKGGNDAPITVQNPAIAG
jgi:hypothetical protein